MDVYFILFNCIRLFILHIHCIAPLLVSLSSECLVYLGLNLAQGRWLPSTPPPQYFPLVYFACTTSPSHPHHSVHLLMVIRLDQSQWTCRPLPFFSLRCVASAPSVFVSPCRWFSQEILFDGLLCTTGHAPAANWNESALCGSRRCSQWFSTSC